MRTIFVTHKHMDHLLGILWLMRMMCQSWRRGTYEGEAVIYGHERAHVDDKPFSLYNLSDSVRIDVRP